MLPFKSDISPMNIKSLIFDTLTATQLLWVNTDSEPGVRFPTAPNTFSPEGLASLVIRLPGGQRVKVSGMSVLFN